MRAAIPLEYQTPEPGPPPRRAGDVLRAYGEPTAIIFVLVGTALLFSGSNAKTAFGASLLTGGAGGLIALRTTWLARGDGWGLAFRLQLLLASAVCCVGFSTLAAFLESARPEGWAYWTTENQTFRYTRSQALPLLRLPAAGLSWLLLLGVVWATRRLARIARSRNNPPPQQE